MMFSSHLRSAPDKHVLPPPGRAKGWPVNIEQEPEMFTLIKLTSIPQSHSTGCLTKARLSFTTKSSAHFMVIKLILYVRFGFYFCKYICFFTWRARGGGDVQIRIYPFKALRGNGWFLQLSQGLVRRSEIGL